jgi:hypothetical protein
MTTTNDPTTNQTTTIGTKSAMSGYCECSHHYSDHRRFTYSRIICEVNDCDCSDYTEPIPDSATIADIVELLTNE